MNTLTLKYIIVGNSGVGKSCLLLRYIENKYEPMHDMTIGVEFGTKTLYMENNTVKIQIWDTAGQESFKSIISSYFRGALGAILVFDLTNRDSFNNVKEWMCMVKEKSNTPITMILIGNKSDLVNDRIISEREAYEFAEKNDLTYIETSTKSGDNVDNAFGELNTIIYKKIKNNLIDSMFYQTRNKFKLEDSNQITNNHNNYCIC